MLHVSVKLYCTGLLLAICIFCVFSGLISLEDFSIFASVVYDGYMIVNNKDALSTILGLRYIRSHPDSFEIKAEIATHFPWVTIGL